MPRHSSPTHYYVLHAVIKLQYKFEQLILIFRTCTNQEKFWQTFLELYEQSILKNFQTNVKLHNAIYIIQYILLYNLYSKMVTKSLQYDVSHSHCITTLYCISLIHYSIINIELYTCTVASYLFQSHCLTACII